MRLLLTGPSGSARISWNLYAMLRDNVQHHLEEGAPSARFRALHALEQAIDRGTHQVNAARLRGEVMGAWYGLSKLGVGEAAVSFRTRSIMTGCPAPPVQRGTAKRRLTGWSLPVPASKEEPSLVEHALGFVLAVLRITETAVDGDVVVVTREGSAPRFAAAAPASAAR